VTQRCLIVVQMPSSKEKVKTKRKKQDVFLLLNFYFLIKI